MERKFAFRKTSNEYNKKLLKIIAEKRYKNTYYLNFKEIRNQMIVSYISKVESLKDDERAELIEQLKEAGNEIERIRLDRVFESLNLNTDEKKIVSEYLEIHSSQIGDFLSDEDFRNRILQESLKKGKLTNEEYVIAYLDENHNQNRIRATSAVKEFLFSRLNSTLSLFDQNTKQFMQAA